MKGVRSIGCALLMPQNYMANDLPTLRNGEALGMAGTQVVAVRLCVVAQRTQDGHRIRVHIGESCRCFSIAGDLATRALVHRAPSLRPCTHRRATAAGRM